MINKRYKFKIVKQKQVAVDGKLVMQSYPLGAMGSIVELTLREAQTSRGVLEPVGEVPNWEKNVRTYSDDPLENDLLKQSKEQLSQHLAGDEKNARKTAKEHATESGIQNEVKTQQEAIVEEIEAETEKVLIDFVPTETLEELQENYTKAELIEKVEKAGFKSVKENGNVLSVKELAKLIAK